MGNSDWLKSGYIAAREKVLLSDATRRGNFVLCAFLLALPCTTLAAKGDFTFSAGNEVVTFPAGCVSSFADQPKAEEVPDYAVMQLTSACGEKLKRLSRQHIGQRLSITYNGSPLTSALLVSVISISFKIEYFTTNRMVLRQALHDYQSPLNEIQP